MNRREWLQRTTRGAGALALPTVLASRLGSAESGQAALSAADKKLAPLKITDVRTILTGAIPAALMALVAHGMFELLGLVLIPAGLRRRP